MSERAGDAGSELEAELEVSLNGEPRRVARGASIAQLLTQLGLRPELVAVELNRELVPRRLHAETRLRAGDRVELVTLVGGG